MKKIVVNLVGGGIRGVVQAVILAELEARIGRPLALFADLVVGNSTGGILAGLLTISRGGKAPLYSAADAISFYQKEGPGIFHRSWYGVSPLLHVKYPAEPIETALKKYMGDARLSDALTNTMIAYADWHTYELGLFKSHKIKRLKSLGVKSLISSYDVPVWYAARGTSAAFSYFPPIDGLIDGGAVATNPGMFALTEAKKLWPDDELHLITIGNGLHQKQFPIEGSANWGSVKLVPYIIEFLLNGPANEVRHMVEVWNPGRTYEIQRTIDSTFLDPAMDAASPENISKLIKFGRDMIESNSSECDLIVDICR